MDLAGDIVQSLANYLGLEDLGNLSLELLIWRIDYWIYLYSDSNVATFTWLKFTVFFWIEGFRFNSKKSTKRKR